MTPHARPARKGQTEYARAHAFELAALYEEGLSLRKVADRHGLDYCIVRLALAEIGVERRQTAKQVRNSDGMPTAYKHGNSSTYYIPRAMPHKRGCCASCGATEDLVLHHKDEDRHNNEPDNLMTLCRACHSAGHSRWKWDHEWKHRRKSYRDAERNAGQTRLGAFA